VHCCSSVQVEGHLGGMDILLQVQRGLVASNCSSVQVEGHLGGMDIQRGLVATNSTQF
jgi:hypothetical protein